MCDCGEKIIPLCCYQEKGEYSIDHMSYWDLIKKVNIKKKYSEYCDKCGKSTEVIKHIDCSICKECKNVIGKEENNYILLDNCSFNNKCLKCLKQYQKKSKFISSSDLKQCDNCNTYVNINCKNMAVCYSQSMECVCVNCFNESQLECDKCGKKCDITNINLPIVLDCQSVLCIECEQTE
ncbi:hypothetical protein Catovirus_1_147 [Catovirus CTV1]|uniref:Uncharacterized protein n=1 Tax=Catovirus CTV1 TaxID=1977631 RepID=A0A1V0S8R3_9VIRU|nr:hypothetical protein Catovirus_1_147 [Catovirus CTV1]